MASRRAATRSGPLEVERLFALHGKVALVTGGSRGIGAMIAAALVAAGARVYVASRKLAACEAVADELGPSCIPLTGDVASEEGCVALAAAVAEREPALHVLVNNAGRTWGAPLDDYPASAFDDVMALNVRGSFLLTRELLPHLQRGASVEDPSRVLMIGSVDGLRVPTFESYAYSASKAAVHHLTRHLARALAERHVTVNAIAPGLFPSRMTAALDEATHDSVRASVPRGRVGAMEDLAGAVLYLTGRGGTYTTGTVLPVDGGLTTVS